MYIYSCLHLCCFWSEWVQSCPVQSSDCIHLYVGTNTHFGAFIATVCQVVKSITDNIILCGFFRGHKHSSGLSFVKLFTDILVKSTTHPNEGFCDLRPVLSLTGIDFEMHALQLQLDYSRLTNKLNLNMHYILIRACFTHAHCLLHSGSCLVSLSAIICTCIYFKRFSPKYPTPLYWINTLA